MKLVRLHRCLLVLLTLACFQPTRAQEATAVSQVMALSGTGQVTAVNTKGKVTLISTGVTSTGKIVVLKEPVLVPAGSRIETGPDAAVSLSMGRAGIINMDADSSARLPDASEKGHSLELLKGRLFMNISGDELRKRAAGEFRLKTPTSLLAVKGTKFFAISKDGADVVGVHEGEIGVSAVAPGKSATVSAGHVLTVKDGEISTVRELDADERGLDSRYQAALVAHPVELLITGQKPSFANQALLKWAPLKMFAGSFTTSSGSVLPDGASAGVIRYKADIPQDRRGWLQGTVDLVLPGTSKEVFEAGIMGLEATCKASGLRSVRMAWSWDFKSDTYALWSSPLAAEAALADDQPASLVVPLPLSKGKKTSSLRLLVLFDLDKTPKENRRKLEIELSDFCFLALPR